MTVDLPCGRQRISVQWDEEAYPGVRLLESRPATPLADLGHAVAQGLETPIHSEPLARIAQGRRSACVVVSDATRPVPNRDLLPPILETLARAGVPQAAVTLLIATGMHRATEPEERRTFLGSDIAARYRVADHDCRDPSNLVGVAELDGVAIEVNRSYHEADLKILTGLIEPHGFAGFSGGGKSILPGLAGFEAIAFMHSFAMVEHPGVGLARMGGNPFRSHIDAVSRAAGADFIVNVLHDRYRRAYGVVAGDVCRAHRAGCRLAAEHSVVQVDASADLVVTSGGGHPTDGTLYQAIKGLFAARDLVRPGGTILFIAGCEEGFGSDSFRNLIRAAGSPGAFRERHRDPACFAVDQWAAQAFFQVRERAGRLLFHSPGLAREDLVPFGFTRIEDPTAALTELLPSHRRAYVVPEGPHLVGLCSGSRRVEFDVDGSAG